MTKKYARLWVLTLEPGDDSAWSSIYTSEKQLLESLRENYGDDGLLDHVTDDELGDELTRQGVYVSWEALWVPFDELEIVA